MHHHHDPLVAHRFHHALRHPLGPHVVRCDVVVPGLDPESLRKGTASYRKGPLLYLGLTLPAVWNPYVSLADITFNVSGAKDLAGNTQVAATNVSSGTDIDTENAPRQRRQFPLQVRIVADLPCNGALHPVNPRNAVGAAHYNFVAQWMSDHGLNAAL